MTRTLEVMVVTRTQGGMEETMALGDMEVTQTLQKLEVTRAQEKMVVAQTQEGMEGKSMLARISLNLQTTVQHNSVSMLMRGSDQVAACAVQ